MPTRREILWLGAAVAAAPAGVALASTFPQPSPAKLLPLMHDDVTLREIAIFADGTPFAEEPPTALERINVRRTVLWHQRMLQTFVTTALDIDEANPQQQTDVVATPERVRSLRSALNTMMAGSKLRGCCREYQVGVAGVDTNWVFSIAFKHASPEISVINAWHTTRWTDSEVRHIADLARADVPLPASYTA